MTQRLLLAIRPLALASIAFISLTSCMTDSERKDLENRLDETIQDLERTQTELDRTLTDWQNDLDQTISDLDETVRDYDSWSACMEVWDYAPPAGACD